jgi:hypothetical protein
MSLRPHTELIEWRISRSAAHHTEATLTNSALFVVQPCLPLLRALFLRSETRSFIVSGVFYHCRLVVFLLLSLLFPELI